MQPTDLLAAIVDQAPDAIVFADREGLIRVWNSGAEKLFGFARAEVEGQSLDVIIPERLRRAHWEGFDRAIATGRTKNDGRATITRSMRKDGAKLYIDVSFSLVKDATGAVVGALAIARDAGARQDAERTMRARIGELEAALEKHRVHDTRPGPTASVPAASPTAGCGGRTYSCT